MKRMKGDKRCDDGDIISSQFHHHPPLADPDSPYVRAKHLQLVEKDPDAAIVFFWKAIHVGDRVDSALKDMAVVLKQQDRAEVAIDAIRSFRDRCSVQAQESLDNVLIDLYKKCGRLEEQIELLKQKLWMICRGSVFNGKPTKTARSHGKKFRVTVEQETSRILGNLGWAYMQLGKYAAAELVYQKAQVINPDSNKACNLAYCLIKQARYAEARPVLEDVLRGAFAGSDDPKSRSRAEEMMSELSQSQSQSASPPEWTSFVGLADPFIEEIDQLMREWVPSRSKRLPVFEEISPFRNQFVC
ncbi:hypothetical protein MLD38_027205 [Melastoma candidum]|uniref:Uncharacterized protein n=1 Tax=Melastoma candidum TaxID=119954 RepID=A0ACB9P2V9_9MYRT|nr:hypothetical protein MLD38_027205 [Melastoma candidum]